jgi:predicted MFS family arabinose efflux permease
MDAGIIGVLIPIIISLGAFVMVVFLRRYQNVERMAMIERGLSPADSEWHDRSKSTSGMKWGLLLIGIGLGFLMGYFLDRQFYMDEVGYFSMIFIFGGLGLVAAHLYMRKQEKEQHQA